MLAWSVLYGKMWRTKFDRKPGGAIVGRTVPGNGWDEFGKLGFGPPVNGERQTDNWNALFAWCEHVRWVPAAQWASPSVGGFSAANQTQPAFREEANPWQEWADWSKKQKERRRMGTDSGRI